jgi:DNA helicase-2/ATP-dependent DNA helicase PcrA
MALHTHNTEVILGPPGTGKTRTLLAKLERELATGVSPSKIAFVAFTRAARFEVQHRVAEKFCLRKRDLPWLRTIHSTAFSLLQLTRDAVMDDEHSRAFAKKYGYQFSDFDIGLDGELLEPSANTDDDLLRYAHDLGRNCGLSPDDTLRRVPVAARSFREYVQRLTEFKRETGVLDYIDMLERVVTTGRRPDVDVAFIDEAQDLSPLQIACVEQWFSSCARVYVAGDDDQAIYGFQGANANWLRGLAASQQATVLAKSGRVPSAVHQLAQRVIGRNVHRLAKQYEPRDAEGVVTRITSDDIAKLVDPAVSTFVLARNRYFLQPIAKTLYDRALPYMVEGTGGWSPLSRPAMVAAVRAAYALQQQRPVDGNDLKRFVDHLAERGDDKYGTTVAKVSGLDGIRPPYSYVRDHVLPREVIDRIVNSGGVSVLRRIHPLDRLYFQRLVERFGGIPEKINIRLKSIHGSKGQQAQTVIVLPDMSKSTHDEFFDGRNGGFEAENRVAYVAVTRAIEQLYLVEPTHKRFYDYPFVRGRTTP